MQADSIDGSHTLATAHPAHDGADLSEQRVALGTEDLRLRELQAQRAGCQGVSAINTILCVTSVDLDTLRPEPTVEGYTTPGGYSCKAVRPIALRSAVPASPRAARPAGRRSCRSR